VYFHTFIPTHVEQTGIAGEAIDYISIYYVPHDNSASFQNGTAAKWVMTSCLGESAMPEKRID
jgi:hypothetical protein